MPAIYVKHIDDEADDAYADAIAARIDMETTNIGSEYGPTDRDYADKSWLRNTGGSVTEIILINT